MRCIAKFAWLPALLLVLPCPLSFVLAGQTPSAAQPLDDAVETLTPRQPRTEEEEDRLAAIAHFSAGYTLEQRRKLPEALRHYERALRYGPEAGPVLREMVPLAFNLNRSEEALRYAVKYVEQNPVDAGLLEQVAKYLAQSGEWEDALKLYQQLAQLPAKEKGAPSPTAVQLELGRLYFLTEQYPRAAAVLQQVFNALEKPTQAGLDPTVHKALLGEGGSTYELMGAAFLEAEQLDRARQAFERFNKIQPDAPTLALNLARVHLAAGKPQDALNELQKCLDSDLATKSVVVYELLAKSLEQLKQRDQLIPRLEVLRQAHPKNSVLSYFLGQQYREAGTLEKAQELLESSHAEKPTVQSYRGLADVYRRTNQTEKLLKLLTQIAEKTGSLSMLESEGPAIAADEKLTTSLIKAAKAEHGAAAAGDRSALQAIALIAAEAKRWDDAGSLFNLAIKAEPKRAAELLLVWGLGLLLDEKYAQAAEVFQRGIDEKALPDDNPAFYFYLAGALEMAGKTEEALAAANTAATKKSSNPEFFARPAAILYRAKRYDDAAKAYQELIDKFDDDFTNDRVREVLHGARLVLSNICVRQHEIPQAVEWLEQVLDEFPDDPGANNDLGYLWADEKQHLNRAHRMIQLALAAEPENRAYRDSLGWVLFRLGRYAEALVQMQKAANTEHPDGEILDHLGEVYAKLSQFGEAKAAWTRAVEAFKKEDNSERMKAVEAKLRDLK